MNQRKADKARIIIGAMFRDGMNKQEMLELLECTREMVASSTTLWDVCRKTPQERRGLRTPATGRSVSMGHHSHIGIHECHIVGVELTNLRIALEAVERLGKK